jgi:hypothetical protein
MYVFSLDIPFKGSQSHSNTRSKVTAVSYLHKGVIDTAVQPTLSIYSANTKPYSKTRVLGGSCLMKKKQRSKISCQGPFKKRDSIMRFRGMFFGVIRQIWHF